MKATLQTDASSLVLELEDVAEAEKFFAEAEKQEGFFLQLDRELKQFARLGIAASAPPGFRFRFEAEVVQVFPGAGSWGTACQLAEWTPAKRRELERKLGAGGRQEGEMGTSPLFRIREMTPNERFRLATKASRPERQILLRDTSPQVLLGLLAHPRLELKEVKAIIDSNFATASILKRVAANRKWMQDADIQLAVVRSPKTPPPVAIRLLPFLRTSDLRALAKGSMSREAVRKAALKVYLQRTGRR